MKKGHDLPHLKDETEPNSNKQHIVQLFKGMACFTSFEAAR
jgi:hypothetical protein